MESVKLYKEQVYQQLFALDEVKGRVSWLHNSVSINVDDVESLGNLMVVCDGGKTNADAYGWSGFYFVVDAQTGDLTKFCLVY